MMGNTTGSRTQDLGHDKDPGHRCRTWEESGGCLEKACFIVGMSEEWLDSSLDKGQVSNDCRKDCIHTDWEGGRRSH